MSKHDSVWSSPTPLFDTAEQQATPYADAVRAFSERDSVSLMVPGHGNDAGVGSAALHEYFGGELAKTDIPLMIEGVDLGPNSPLVQARELAAKAWGANKTWFLTNGASQANRIAALAVAGLGKNILMQRSSHSSFTDGVLAAGLKPSFMLPSVDFVNGASHGLTPEDVERGFAEAHEPIAAVYIVSPSYFGATADVAGIAEVAHKHGAALIVDGAWGAHFGFHEALPESPARLGADLTVSSTHKLAGSLTQSAMIHLGDGPFTERLLPFMERAFSMTASTSMSAILLASLDLARRSMALGREQISKSVAVAQELRERLRADERFAVLSDGFEQYPDIAATDPLRVPIDVSQLAETGHWVRDYCMHTHNVYFEMSTATLVVAVIGAGAAPSVDRIMAALDGAAKEAGLAADRPDVKKDEFPPIPAPGELVMLPRDAFFSEIEQVPAAEAVGRISADSLAAYPPGIPNVSPGEVITQDVVDFLTDVAASPSGYVRGAVDPLVTTYRVVKWSHL
ncbi:MAG: aminotransferase class V-fold PLP-dependent enzyme [Microbacteriaceae bacterium]|nr:aminotransferase class V-fold PLP-dependent enzyme [Microbacteriaceae bacterium]